MRFELETDEDEDLIHYGILRRSGRYPYGSGGPEKASNQGFLDMVATMRKSGMSEKEIAKGLGINSTELRRAKTIARNDVRQDRIRQIEGMKAKGMGASAIGRQLGIPESQVRALLADGVKDKANVLQATADMLKAQIKEKGYIDVGSGVELDLPIGNGQNIGITRDKFDTAISKLREEGYKMHYVQVQQLGRDTKTSIKVLGAPDSKYPRQEQVQLINAQSDDGGRTFRTPKPPLSISSKRVGVRYAEDGGADADGVIYVRPGVKDVSLGGARYGQVRIAVDGTHFLKGMAVYKDDLPAGQDLVFNTNKKNTGNKLDAMKPMKEEENPFGSITSQIVGSDGKLSSVMNRVGTKEGAGLEGSWDTWSKSLSSQVLSKQQPTLAKQQLDMTYERKKSEFDEIMALTNPSVKKRLMESFAEDTDSSAVYMKAAALPRQATRVLLPVNSIKPNEVYAPGFRQGERVALIRYPHGGTFEIPELTVNNRHAPAKKMIGDGLKTDAIGIHHSVAERLSGADFDGDTVLVIPNGNRHLETAPALKGLKGFDPQVYKIKDLQTDANGKITDSRYMKPSRKQNEMGDITNLIADMTIRGAGTDKVARAIRHSMVVIDAEKHKLDYKASARANGIPALKSEYQDGGGASTLITRAKSADYVNKRRLARVNEGGPVDPITGKKRYVDTGEVRVTPERRNKRTGEVIPGKEVLKLQPSKKLAETDDAHTLSSGTRIERTYADHSNRLKALANEARKEVLAIQPERRQKSAAETYRPQVASLDAKLRLAKRNAPLERQAQLIANVGVRARKKANPELEPSDVKKIQAQELAKARERTGAKKDRIQFTPDEWAAVQAGAISPHKLGEIMDNADIETVRTLATPRTPKLMTSVKTQRAQQMIKLGYSQAEIADQLGVSVSTLKVGLG